MTNHNEENERIKRQYFAFLREARRRSPSSVEAAAAAIDRFEAASGRRSFKTFHREQAIAFKRKLARANGQRSGEPLSRSTLDSTLRTLVAFFSWLASQPGYRSHFTETDAEHFNLSLTEARAGRVKHARPHPTLEQVQHVLATMRHTTDVERRDRALVALALLTAARDGALRTLRLKHLQLDNRCLHQDPREVATKFSKEIRTYFFPVGDLAEFVVQEWTHHLRSALHWGPDDPLFPATRMVVGPGGGFAAAGLERKFWSTAAPVQRIFRQAFEGAGLPYFHPHSIRHTLSKLGTQVCQTPEQLKAWSQNLGHADVLITLMSYGEVPTERQASLISALRSGPNDDDHKRQEMASLVRRLAELTVSQRGVS